MKPTVFRCIFKGSNAEGTPQKLDYEQVLSKSSQNKLEKNSIYWCKGDKNHQEHFIILKYSSIYNIRYDKGTWVAKGSQQRFVPQQKTLKCPVGKTLMRLQSELTKKTCPPNVDIYRCKGIFRGRGHSNHYCRIEFGYTKNLISGKRIPVVIADMERTA